MSGRRNATVVIVAGCLIALVTYGLRTSFGLFTDPLSDLRGWDREAFALAIGLQNLMWGIGQPFAGAIADRYGAGRVLAVGGVLYAAGTVLMAMSTSAAALSLTGGVLLGFGLSGASFTIVLAAFARLVPPERRSWSLGLATAAGSLGQFLFAPLGQSLHQRLRPGHRAAAAVLLHRARPAARHRADRPRLAGRARRRARGVDRATRSAARSHTRATCCSSAASSSAASTSRSSRRTSRPTSATSASAPGLAAWALALIGLFNVIGAYSAGLLGGVHSKRLLLSGIYLSRAIVFALFLLIPTTPFIVLLFAAAMGLLWLSTVPLTSGLVAVMFGTRHVGMLFGFVFLSHQIGAFIGVWLGGAVYEATGTYDLMWWISIALSLTAAALHLPILERRAPQWAPVAA